MKKTIRYICIFLCVALSAATMTACTGYSDIETSFLVSGIAVDFADSLSFGHREYLVTVEIIPMRASNQGSDSFSYLISQQADTFLEALRLITAEATKPLFYGHCKLLVIGQEVASEGFLQVVEYLFRDSKLRFPMNICVTRSATAKQVLRARATMDTTNSYELIEMMQSTALNVGIAPSVQLLPFIDALADEEGCCGIPFLCPAKDAERDTISAVGGTAIIKDYKLLGYLNRENSAFAMLASGEYEQGVINCFIPSEETIIPFKVLGTDTKISVDIDGDGIIVNFDSDIRISVIELPINEMAVDRQRQDRFFTEASYFISQNMFCVVKDTLDRYGADIFGITGATRSDHPDFWKNNRHRWSEVLRTAKIRTEVSVGLRSSEVSGQKLSKGVE